VPGGGDAASSMGAPRVELCLGASRLPYRRYAWPPGRSSAVQLEPGALDAGWLASLCGSGPADVGWKSGNGIIDGLATALLGLIKQAKPPKTGHVSWLAGLCVRP
jgi:hypothetical protein